MESIIPLSFSVAEMQVAQALAIERATLHTDEVLREYCARSDTYGGRYVCADTMKELLPGYARSPASRNALHDAVHNSASVLAAEQFRRVVERAPTSESNVAVFVTGIPGAGKTTAVQSVVAKNAAVVFEGPLKYPQAAFDKIERTLKAGLDVHIMAVHVSPEVALDRTNTRFLSPHDGRGAPIAYMAEIQGNLPQRLAQIREKFGDSVQLVVVDNTPRQEHVTEGWKAGIAHLEKAGHHDEISQRLHTALDAGYREGRYSTEFYQQAAGCSPAAELGAARRSASDRGLHPDANRPEVSRGNAKEDALTPYAQGKRSRLEVGVQKTADIPVVKPSSSNVSTSGKNAAEKSGLCR